MSFTQTSQLNSLLLRGLQFRTNSNVPISTSYALYADGRGGTFWDQALKASDLSSYSTSVGDIAESQSTLTFYTTSSVSGIEQQVIILEQDFSTLAESVSTQIEDAIFSFSTNQFFIDQLSSIQLELETEISSIYSTLSSYDITNFSTLSSYIETSQNLTFGYTDSSISTVYTQSVSTSQANLDIFSTSINNAVISTSIAFVSTIVNQNSSLAIYISTDTAETASTNSSFLTSISSLTVQISTLQYVSSMMDTTLSSYIIPYVTSSLSSYNVSTQSTFFIVFSTLDAISTIAISTAKIALSTANGFAGQITTLSSATAQNTTNITTLSNSFSLLTTSTLISSIYDSFIGLQNFCSNLVISTNAGLTSTLNSTTEGYISTIYSTIVTDILEQAGEAFGSTIVSTSAGLTSTFVSTLSTIYVNFTSSLTFQLDSSILAYVSTPIASSIQQFSTMSRQVISTFSTQYETALVNFSTMGAQEISTFSTQYETALVNFSTMTFEEISTFSTQYETALANFSTLSETELSTFSTLYYSTLYQTNETFNNFVAGLQNFVSSSALSTLYTEQLFTLSGDQSTALLDLPAFRNFAIFVSDVVDNYPYRITYDPTALYGMDWKTGTILINVLSTGGYSYNNGKMIMDLYRFGFPTSIYDSMFPTLSSADYTLMYDYRIYNSTIYTTLQNVFPRLRILNASASAGIVGTFTADWTNYSWIPTGLIGAPPFAPQINVDLLQGGVLLERFGPYDISISSITESTAVTGSTDISIYFAGNFGEGTVVNNVNL
jgi:hypothetical protein